jgi:hypothetical protein
MANEPSPKHGSSPKSFPDRDKKRTPEDHRSESQADGTAAESPRGETQSQPSGVGPTGQHPATAGPGPTTAKSETPENRTGQINPSAPTDSTESASGEWEDVERDLPANPTMDSAGEVGEPSGRGTLDVDPEVFEGNESAANKSKKKDKAA